MASVDPQNGDESPEVAEALDAYLSDLQQGRQPNRAGLLQKYPELAEMLDYLDLLEGLAPPSKLLNDSSLHAVEDSDELPLTLLSDSGLPSSHATEFAAVGVEWAGDFGRYELMEEIGRGGMGVVYRAKQKDLDRVVALKMVLSSQLASTTQVERFYAEARAAGSLHHPNIVRVHDVGQIHGQPYFAMELVEGQSLAGCLRAQGLDFTAAAECLAAVARAVDYLHRCGVVHRDLKPSNILLDEEGRPMVTDFGLAKMLNVDSQLTQSGVIAGTPSYMSPEQAAGRSELLGPASDIYSLGAILYEMLTGQPPFREATPLDTLVQVLEGEPARPRERRAEVPVELELICLKCLEKNAEARYASAGELAEDIDRYLRGDAVEARPNSWWGQLRRWSRREPALASHLIGILTCSLIIQLKYHLVEDGTTPGHHFSIQAPLPFWIAASFLFQWMLNRQPQAELPRLLWAGLDCVFMTLELMLANEPLGSLSAAFPMLVAASGLWFQTRLVTFTTALSSLCYLGLVAYLPSNGQPPHYHLLFIVFLWVIGFVVGHQVHRVRALSRYYANRRL